MDLVCTTSASETLLDAAFEDLDFGTGQIPGWLALEVTVKGGALLVDEPDEALERHVRWIADIRWESS